MPRRSRRLRRALILGSLAVLLLLLSPPPSFLLPAPAKATISEQRARLPPPAECEDPVAGVWKSHAYYPSHGQWYIFTLSIYRAETDGELTGTVHSHYWSGTPEHEEPPPCSGGGYHQTVLMPADGTVNDLRIEFGGTSWQLEQTFCGPPVVSYYPDRFSGVIDPEIQEFQSVNNDGGPMVDYPTVFRRISCHQGGPTPPPVVVAPPEFYPSRGCDCSFF
ncbi:MAG: hypothetical protein AAGF12_35150 [Myxococcota bacterium]